MNWDTVQQFVRILSGWVASYLVTAGFIDQSNATILAGALLGLVQVAWWAFWNRKRDA
jgi:hypothetical protein